MRWLLTRADAGLSEALRAAGEEVLDRASWTVDRFCDPTLPGSTMKAYPLAKVVGEAKPDVLVLVDLFVPKTDGGLWGYPRATIAPWRNRRDLTLVTYSREDPAVWATAKGGHIKACFCRPQDCGVYLSSRGTTARDARRVMRALAWAPGAPISGLLEAVRATRAGEIYRPPRK